MSIWIPAFTQFSPVRFCSVLVYLCICYATVEAQTFQGLGFQPGGNSSDAAGVSADGSVVVGSANGLSPEPGFFDTFRWTSGGGMYGITQLEGEGTVIGSDAAAVSADGSVLVGGTRSMASGAEFQAFRSSGSSSPFMIGLGFLPGQNDSYANGVSADGSVIVGYSRVQDSFYQAIRWTGSDGMVGLGFLPGGISNSVAFSVSGDGSVVVGNSGGQAFRWTSGGMVGLGFLPGTSNSVANAVSLDGSVAVGISGTQAFRWTSGGGMVDLGLAPGASNSVADAVSGDGSVIVGDGATSSGVEAFIWDASQGMRSLQAVLTNDYGLNLTGWTLQYANGISSNGATIVGSGIDPSGQAEAWIAQIPEPATWMMVILGTGALVGLWQRLRVTQTAVSFVRVFHGEFPRI